MLEYVELETVLWVLVIIIFMIGYSIDTLSRSAVKNIEDLQNRVYELEKRLGIRGSSD